MIVDYKKELKELVNLILKAEHGPDEKDVVKINADHWREIRDTADFIADDFKVATVPVEYDGHRFTKPDHIQFCRDMEDAGLEIEYYEGIGSWTGPVVRVRGGGLMYVCPKILERVEIDEVGQYYILRPCASGGVEEVK